MIAPYIKTAVDEVDVDSLFAKMSETKANPGVKEVCQGDALIRVFARSRLERIGPEGEQRPKDMNVLNQKCRTLGRLLNVLNESTVSWQPLDYFIRAPKFDNVLLATQKLQKMSDSPKLACNIGHYISTCADLKKGQAIRANDDVRKKDAKNFLDLFAAEWTNKISAVANRRMALKQLNKPILTPITEDLVTLSQWLSQEIKNIVDVQQPTSAQCKRLASLLLVKIVIFNKRRISEVQELLVEDYTNRSKVQDVREETLNSLGTSERTLAKRFVMQVYFLKVFLNSKFLILDITHGGGF